MIISHGMQGAGVYAIELIFPPLPGAFTQIFESFCFVGCDHQRSYLHRSRNAFAAVCSLVHSGFHCSVVHQQHRYLGTQAHIGSNIRFEKWVMSRVLFLESSFLFQALLRFGKIPVAVT
jgi:hypothetical protein